MFWIRERGISFCGKLIESFERVGTRTVTEQAVRHECVNLLK